MTQCPHEEHRVFATKSSFDVSPETMGLAPIESHAAIIGISGPQMKADLTPAAQLIITNASKFDEAKAFFWVCLIIGSGQHAGSVLAKTTVFPHSSMSPFRYFIPLTPPTSHKLAQAPHDSTAILFDCPKEYFNSRDDLYFVSIKYARPVILFYWLSA